MSNIVLQKFEHTRGGATGKKYYDFLVWIDGQHRATWQHELHGRGYNLSVRSGLYYATLKFTVDRSNRNGSRSVKVPVFAENKSKLEEITKEALDKGVIPTLEELHQLELKYNADKARQDASIKESHRRSRIEHHAEQTYAILKQLRAFDLGKLTEEAQEIIRSVEQDPTYVIS